MKLRPFQVPDSQVTGASQARLGCLRAGHGAQFGHVNDQARRGDAGDAGDRGQDLGAAPEGLLGSKEPLCLGVDALQLALDLREPFLVDPLGQGVAQVLAAVEGGRPIRDERVTDQPQLGEIAVAGGLRRLRAQVADRVRHRRQRPGIDSVRLGAMSPGARETPDLVRIDRVPRKSGLQQDVLEVAVEGPQ